LLFLLAEIERGIARVGSVTSLLGEDFKKMTSRIATEVAARRALYG